MKKKNIRISMIIFCSFIFLKAGYTTQIFQEEPLSYKWSKHFKIDDDPEAHLGVQVLHFSANKKRHYTLDPKAKEFVEIYCKGVVLYQTDADILRCASDLTSLEGFYLEMGTGAAKSTNFIAALNPKKTIHTFDSYEGLPENWNKGSRVISKGAFARLDPQYIPPMLNNVRFHLGSFVDSLPLFKKEILQNNDIAFLSIDSDLYSSAKIVFDILGDNLSYGTVIHLDELYNYPNFEQEEWKALKEYAQDKNFDLEFKAINEFHEQAVVILRKPSDPKSNSCSDRTQ